MPIKLFVQLIRLLVAIAHGGMTMHPKFSTVTR
jgi:hypothetical protein